MDNFDELGFIDDILDAIEEEFGQQVQRVAKCDLYNDEVMMTIIFEDYGLLEATAKIDTFSLFDVSTVKIQGKYY